MSKPDAGDSRMFYRCALQRYEEAEVLLATLTIIRWAEGRI